MLRRLTLGFGSVALALAFAACSSSTAPISVGPTFQSASLYATNATQNAISIYPLGTASGSAPQYQIGGASTRIAGPQYLAFDATSDLFVSNYNQTTSAASIIELKALATGNVIPLNQTITGIVRPRGLAIFNAPSFADALLAVANVNPAAGTGYTSQLVIFDATTLGTPLESIAGPATGMSVPSGIASDSNGNLYVANLQGASVEGFTLPQPSPTPSGSPSPTPSPTATPSAAPSTSPTPIPTATPLNLAPTFTLSGSQTGLVAPVSVALDSSNTIYVADQGNPGAGVAPSIRVFTASPVGTLNIAPIRTISGAATLLNAPSDIKVDSSGRIYVSDSTTAGAGVIYVYAAGASGDVAPVATYPSPGSVIGIALAP